MIARAKGKHFLVYNGAERVMFDAKPSPTRAHLHRRNTVRE